MSPGPVFVYSSQGTQRPGAGRRLSAEQPRFRAALAACDREIAASRGWSLLERIERGDRELYERDDMIQPALTAVQIALGDLLLAEGVRPAAVAGLSMGEAAAWQLAGSLSLKQAMHVACEQAELATRSVSPGAMAFVVLDADATRRELDGSAGAVQVAAELAPELTIISGATAALDRQLDGLQRRGLRCGTIRVGNAYHSSEAAAQQAELVSRLSTLSPRPASLPVYSSVTGDRMSEDAPSAAYWGRILRDPARWLATVQSLLRDGFATFVELGTQPMLGACIAATAAQAGRRVRVISLLGENADEVGALDDALHALCTPPHDLRRRASPAQRSGRSG